MLDMRFKRAIGRIMESLEIAGVQNAPLKQQIKGYLWDLHDDLVLVDEKYAKEGEPDGNK